MIAKAGRASLMSVERRPRMSSADVEQVMIETAVDVVNTYGLTVSLDHISMDSIIAEARVARSAAYRVWPQRSKFIKDLLIAIAKSSSVQHAAYDPGTLRAALEEVREWKGKLTTAEDRRQAMVAAVRVGALRNFATLSKDKAWQTEITLRATIMSFPDDGREKLRHALDESINTYLKDLAAYYEVAGKLLGYEMIPGRDYLYLASTGAAIIEGLLLRGVAGVVGDRTPSYQEVALTDEFEADPFNVDRMQKWNAASIAFTANLLALSRPIENFDPKSFDIFFDQLDEMVKIQEATPEMRKD